MAEEEQSPQPAPASVPDAFDAPFRVGTWWIDPSTRAVRPESGEEGSGEVQRLGHKPLAVLQCLARRGGGVCSKDDLIDEVWDGAITTDDAVMAVVYELRKALGDDAKEPRYVETIRQRGYRLVAEVELESPDFVDASPVRTEGERETVESARSTHGGARSVFAAAALIVVASLIAAVGLAWWQGRHGLAPDGTLRDRQPDPEPAKEQWVDETVEIRSLALRPFATFGEQCLDDPFVDSLTELLIAELVDGPPLALLPSDGDGSPYDASSDAVVEGSIIRSGDGLWVNVRLVQSSSGRLVWGASFERHGTDILGERTLAAEIARQIQGFVTDDAPTTPAPADG